MVRGKGSHQAGGGKKKIVQRFVYQLDRRLGTKVNKYFSKDDQKNDVYLEKAQNVFFYKESFLKSILLLLLANCSQGHGLFRVRMALNILRSVLQIIVL